MRGSSTSGDVLVLDHSIASESGASVFHGEDNDGREVAAQPLVKRQTCSTSVLFPTLPAPTIGSTPGLSFPAASVRSRKSMTVSISICRPNITLPRTKCALYGFREMRGYPSKKRVNSAMSPTSLSRSSSVFSSCFELSAVSAQRGARRRHAIRVAAETERPGEEAPS